jgi:hypothetical protein
MQTEWYEVPVKIWRNSVEMIVPATEVKAGDIVKFKGVKRKCKGTVTSLEDKTVYICFNFFALSADLMEK